MTDISPLFTPLRMGALELPNRILMAPLTRNRAHPDGTPWDVSQTYYGQRASAGLIISEATQVSAEGKGYINTPGIHTQAHADAWRKIVDAVHAGGGRIFLQLWHVGRISHVSLQPNGGQPVSSSANRANAKTFTANGFEDTSEPVALDDAGIARTLDDYENAAKLAREAGFDGVEVHGANGYLIDQFLQDGVNHRTDSYGGAPQKRMRFLEEVLDRVEKVFPRDRIGIRLSPLGQANDMGDSDPEALFSTVIDMLSERGLAYLHMVEEFYGADTDPADLDMLRRLRDRFDGVYIGNGNYDAARAAEAIANGTGDAITFGRPFIANPDLPERFRRGAELNPQDRDTFYGGDETGYTDYPFLKG